MSTPILITVKLMVMMVVAPAPVMVVMVVAPAAVVDRIAIAPATMMVVTTRAPPIAVSVAPMVMVTPAAMMVVVSPMLHVMQHACIYVPGDRGGAWERGSLYRSALKGRRQGEGAQIAEMSYRHGCSPDVRTRARSLSIVLI